MVHEAPATTFVNYQTGDYHLQAGSLAIAGGASSCVAGGASPCVPPNDFVGTVRPTSGAQDVGAYVFVGTGVPIVSFSPSPLNFGTVAVSTPATLTDMLTNIGTGSLTFSPATITGTNASVFVIVSTTCGSSLAGGASCSYTIRATPTAASLQTANLTLTDNASGSPHQLTRQPLSVNVLIASWVIDVPGPSNNTASPATGTSVRPSLLKNSIALCAWSILPCSR